MLGIFLDHYDRSLPPLKKKGASAIDVRDLKDPLAGCHEGQPRAGLWRTSFPPQPRCWPNPDNWSPKKVWFFLNPKLVTHLENTNGYPPN